jgi:putative SOS response-associated peptidase YedK
MCYAFTLLEPDAISFRYAESFPSDWKFSPTYYLNAYEYPSYPVLTSQSPKEFQPMQWGLIPFWIKTRSDAESIRKKTINARTETLFEKPSFRYAAEKQRCLIPADGFFEWRYYQKNNYPYYIYLKDHTIFSFAGVYEKWNDPEQNKTLYTFSVITCDANTIMEKIHNKKKRMPVILLKDHENTWIDESMKKNELKELLVPLEDGVLDAHTISKRVTSRTQKRNVPKVLDPYEYRELADL